MPCFQINNFACSGKIGNYMSWSSFTSTIASRLEKDTDLHAVAHSKQHIRITAEATRKYNDKQLSLTLVKPRKPIPSTTHPRWCNSKMKELGYISRQEFQYRNVRLLDFPLKRYQSQQDGQMNNVLLYFMTNPLNKFSLKLF